MWIFTPRSFRSRLPEPYERFSRTRPPSRSPLIAVSTLFVLKIAPRVTRRVAPVIRRSTAHTSRAH